MTDEPKNQNDLGKNLPPQAPKDPLPNNKEVSDLRTARNLAYGALILIIVSVLLFGGVLFSLIGTICAIISVRKTKRLMRNNQTINRQVKKFWIIGVIGIVLGILGMIANAAYAIMIYPELLQAYESGDMSNFFPQSTSSSSGQSGNSTWG